MTCLVPFHALCFEVCFVWYKHFYPSFLFVSICLDVFFILSLSTCVDLLFWGESLGHNIYMGHIFLSFQLSYVFWLEHLIHLHLMLLSIGTYSLPFFQYLCFSLSLSLSFSVPLFLSLFFYSSPFSISCSASLVETHSFSLILCGKLFISPSILNESLAV